MAASGTSDQTQYLVGRFYDSTMLGRLMPRVVLQPLGKQINLPKGNGTTVYMYKWTEMTSKGTTLTQGENPTKVWMSTTQITVTVRELGDYTIMSKLLDDTAISDVLKEAAEVFGEAAANTVDMDVRDYLSDCGAGGPDDEWIGRIGTAHVSTFCYGKKGGLSSLWLSANGTAKTYALMYSGLTAGADLDPAQFAPTVRMIRMAVRKLRNNNADTFDDGMYALVCNPDFEEMLMRDADYVAWNAFRDGTRGEKGIVGGIAGAKIITTTNMPSRKTCMTGGSACSSVYSLLIGKDAFGVTKLGGEAIKTYRITGASHSNPLDMWSTVGWKVRTATAVLNQKRGYWLMSLIQ